MVGTVQDITDWKRAEEACNEHSFISAKGSASLIWVAGHSTLLDSNIGLPNCSKFTAWIRVANRQR
jgi:hypothetical protein